MFVRAVAVAVCLFRLHFINPAKREEQHNAHKNLSDESASKKNIFNSHVHCPLNKKIKKYAKTFFRSVLILFSHICVFQKHPFRPFSRLKKSKNVKIAGGGGGSEIKACPLSVLVFCY